MSAVKIDDGFYILELWHRGLPSSECEASWDAIKDKLAACGYNPSRIENAAQKAALSRDALCALPEDEPFLCLPLCDEVAALFMLAFASARRTVFVSRSDEETERFLALAEKCGFNEPEISEIDEETADEVIADFFEEYGYITESSGAAALAAANDIVADGESALALMFADPYEEASRVLAALGESVPEGRKQAEKKLEEITALPRE